MSAERAAGWTFTSTPTLDGEGLLCILTTDTATLWTTTVPEEKTRAMVRLLDSAKERT